MTHKMTWVISLAVVAGGAVLVTRLVSASAEFRPVSSSDQQELAERLKRLEAEVPGLKRSVALTGVQLGAAALAQAKPAAQPDDEGTSEGDAREKARENARAEQEKIYYASLDRMALAGGGEDATAHLRKNIEAARTRSPKEGGKEVDVASMECSDTVCRVEVREKGGTVAEAAQTTAHALLKGMGGLTMRAYEPGKPFVYYLAAPGHDLPRLEP
jgi:hypothetical protein